MLQDGLCPRAPSDCIDYKDGHEEKIRAYVEKLNAQEIDISTVMDECTALKA